MADLYLSASNPGVALNPHEGGPFTEATVRFGEVTVAHWDGSGWYIDDGGAFGSEELTGTTWPIILGQAK